MAISTREAAKWIEMWCQHSRINTTQKHAHTRTHADTQMQSHTSVLVMPLISANAHWCNILCLFLFVYNLSHRKIYTYLWDQDNKYGYTQSHTHTVHTVVVKNSTESQVISDHELTESCWISLLELGMGKALVMHAYPAWFLWSRNGKGTNISSYDPHKGRRKKEHHCPSCS